MHSFTYFFIDTIFGNVYPDYLDLSGFILKGLKHRNISGDVFKVRELIITILCKQIIIIYLLSGIGRLVT